LYFLSLQAYAELEKDTPGQIFGVTFKSDGKSTSSSTSSSKSSEPISEKFTQRPKDEDNLYEEHDVTDTNDFRKNQLGYRVYFVFGVLGAFMLFYLLSSSKTSDLLEYERNRTLAEQQLRQQNQQRSPFDEA
jgi:hypothetical protein